MNISPCCLLLYLVVSQPAASSPTPVASSSNEDSKGDTPKPKKNRCFMCRKRVGLTGEWCDKMTSDATQMIHVLLVCFWFLVPILTLTTGLCNPRI